MVSGSSGSLVRVKLSFFSDSLLVLNLSRSKSEIKELLLQQRSQHLTLLLMVPHDHKHDCSMTVQQIQLTHTQALPIR